MTNVVIASAARTAVGSFLGSFANTPAHDLGTTVLNALVERAGVDKSEVSETILGQVLTAAQGQNPARQAHINAGFPKESAAWGINQVCGSGLRAVALGAQHIMLGDASIIAAGGLTFCCAMPSGPSGSATPITSSKRRTAKSCGCDGLSGTMRIAARPTCAAHADKSR